MSDNLSVEMISKMIDLAIQQNNQSAKQTAQEISESVSAQVAKQVEQVIGSMQSDLVSRFISKDDVDQGDDEQRRADQALGFGGRVYKHNVYDLAQAKEIAIASQQLSLHQSNLNAATIKLVNGSIDQYLGGGQLSLRYNNAKWQQELRHSDIASENQWEDSKELAGDLGGLETVKSLQVPPAATEEK